MSGRAHRRRFACGRAFLVALLALAPRSARAQGAALTFEIGAARSLPAAELGVDPTTYGIGGLRAEWVGRSAALAGGGYGGRTGGAAASEFLSGSVAGEAWLGRGRTIGVGLGASVQAFAADRPLVYRVSAADVGPMLRVGRGAWQWVARGRVGAGSARRELRRSDGTARRSVRDLWSRSVEAELGWAAGRAAVSAVVAGSRSQAGGYRRAGLRVATVAGPVTIRVDGDRWETPAGPEHVGGLTVSLPLGRFEARASVGRTAPDPLTQVEAGTQSGLWLGYRWAAGRRAAGPAVHEVVRPGRPARVRFRVSPPAAERVEVLGDFGGWEPVPLERRGGVWIVELDVQPGLHHFGFLVDGAWWVPEAVQGAVPDEWGRTNATMVIAEEGES